MLHLLTKNLKILQPLSRCHCVSSPSQSVLRSKQTTFPGKLLLLFVSYFDPCALLFVMLLILCCGTAFALSRDWFPNEQVSQRNWD